MPRIFFRLLTMRMRWYAATTGRVLLRHWLWCMVAANFLIPPGIPLPTLMRALAFPLTELVAPGRAPLALLLHLLALHAFAATWAATQRDAVSGGPFMRYVVTLPLSSGARRGVDLAVLAATDNPWLIQFAIAVALSAYSGDEAAYRIAALTATLFVALAAQLAILERTPAALIVAVIADIALALGLGARNWLALVVAPALAGSAFYGDWANRFSAAAREALRKAASKRCGLLPPPPLPLLIQGKALATHSASVALRIGTAIGLAIGTDALIDVFSYDSRSLPTIITALAGIAILLSGVYRILAAAHRTMGHYLRALPARPAYWPLRDMALVAGVGALPLLVLSIPAATHRLAASATVLGLAGADLALLAAMRFPITHGGRHAVLLTVALAGLWATAAMAAVAR